MNVLVATHDLLLQQFLNALLAPAEGVNARFSPLGQESPDGTLGWVVALGREDPDARFPEQVLAREWVAGLLLVGTGGAQARTSAEGPYADHPGLVQVDLPISLSELVEGIQSAQANGARQVHEQANGQTGMARILVAEDSALQRQLVVSTLRSEGFTVDEAEDGEAALEQLQLEGRAYDLLITDVEMPRRTGHELTRALRQDERFESLPVLMLTTLSGYEEIKAGFDAGASDYMVKPLKGEREIFLDDLVERVYHLVRLAQHQVERRVLVVDDSRMTRSMVAGTLAGAGFAVTTAEDGQQAKGLLENPALGLPDLVVTDLEMPIMDGLRLTHFVKHYPRTRDLPVIILSASKVQEHRVLGKGFGVDAFISKPFSDEKLLVTAEQVLSRARLEKEKRELSKIMGRDVLKAIHGEGLGARSRELTILFSDLAGFSKMCFGMDPGQVVKLLNDYFDRFVEFVLREQGYVNKFIGDALMALYSTLPGLDPPPVRAVRAALDFQRDMLTVNRTATEPLLTRVGVNTGEVIMGLIGGGERRDYTVIGDNVNRAQRLESKSPVGGLLLSEGTFNVAREYLESVPDAQVEAVTGLQLKGIARPVTAYAVTLVE